MILVAILMLSQFAQAAVELKARSHSTIMNELKVKEPILEEILRKKKSGAALNDTDKTAIDKMTISALSKSGVSANGIKLLVQIRPELLGLLTAKAEIISNKESNPEQVAQARLDLLVLDTGANKVNVNLEVEAGEKIDVLTRVAKIERYPNSSVEQFKKEYIQALIKGFSPKDAVKEASKNLKVKFDAKKLEELC